MKDGDISNEAEPVVYLDGRGFLYTPKKGWCTVRRKFRHLLTLINPSITVNALHDVELSLPVYFTVCRLKKTYRITFLAADAEDAFVLNNLFGDSFGVSVILVVDETVLAAVILEKKTCFCVSNLFKYKSPIFGAVQRYSDIADALRLLEIITPLAH